MYPIRASAATFEVDERLPLASARPAMAIWGLTALAI